MTDSLYHIDTELQNKIVNLFERVLVHRQGDLTGKHILLEQWQKDFLTDLLCTYDKKGKRRYKKSLLMLPRKNGKTLIVSGAAIAMLLFLPEKGQQIVVAAASAKQAGIIWQNCAFMVRSSAVLRELLEVRQSRIVRKDLQNPGEILVISADASVHDGLNASAVIIDELHAQPNRDLYDVLLTSQVARSDPLCLSVTTAGKDKLSLCHEEYSYAKKVRDGIIDDPTYLPVIYEADPEADWQDIEVWKAANPNFGVSVQESYCVAEIASAKNNPALVPALKRLNLNQWVESETRWINMDQWAACAGDKSAKSLRDFLRGRRCYGGLDLSTKIDLTAFVLVFPPLKKGEPFYILSHCFMPKKGMQQAIKRDRVPYNTWEKEGYLTACPGSEIDQQMVYDFIIEQSKIYDLKSIGFDPFLADWLSTQLDKESKIDMVKYYQKYWAMTPAIQTLNAGILGAKLAHGNDPLLRWAASNVEVKSKGDEIMLVKPDRQRHAIRIDPIVALTIAYDLCVRREGTPDKPKRSAASRFGMLT